VVKRFWQKLHNFLFTDTKITAFYQIFRLGSNVFISIILSKFFFQSQKLSEYETIVLTVSTYVFFWNTGFVRFFHSYFSNYHKDNRNIFISEIFKYSIMIGSITACAYIIFSWNFNFLNLFIGLKILTSVAANPIEYYWLSQKKHKKVILEILLYFSIFIVWTFYSYLYKDFVTMLIGWILLDLIKIFFFAVDIPIFVRTNFKKNFLISIIFLSIGALLSGGVEYVNFWLVKNYYSDIEFLIYRYGAREVPFSSLISFSLSATLTAQISSNSISMEKIYTKIKKLIHLTFPVTIGFLIFSKYLFQIFYGNSLINAYKVFDVFLLFNVTRVLLFDVYLLANQKHSFFLVTSMVELLIVSLVSFCGIVLQWKVEFLAFSVLIAYSVERLVILWKLRQIKIPTQSFYPWSWWSFYTFMLFFLYVGKNYLFN